jgi:hypothetical protein
MIQSRRYEKINMMLVLIFLGNFFTGYNLKIEMVQGPCAHLGLQETFMLTIDLRD